MNKLNKFSRAILAIAIMLCVALPTLAHDFEVDGIYYNFLDKTAKTVKVTYKGNSTGAYSDAYTGNVTIPSSVTYSGTTFSVTSIGSHAFAYCTGLTSVTIPNSVTSIGEAAFYGCTGLTSVNISDLSAWCKIDFSDSYSNPLYYAKNLYLNGAEIKELVIPNDITEIKSYAFNGCDGLTSVTIPNSVTLIGENAFYGCNGLTSVTIPNSVTLIGSDAFSGCDDLTSVTIPNSVTSIGSEAFAYCTGLTSVTIPNSVTSIGKWAFYGCDGLTSVNISDLSAWCKIDFSDYNANPLYYAEKFNLNGTEITNLVIPNDITEINGYAFCGCDGLTSVTIGNSVTTIGEWAFVSCRNIKTIVSLNPTPPTCSSSESFYNYSSTILYVPKDSYAKYFIDDVWGKFTNIKKIEILVSSITLNNSSIELDKGSTATLSATIAPSNATIKNIVWTSSNPQIATVDQSGKVTALSAGTATITAMANDGSNVSATCKVTVNSVTPSISLSKTEATLPVNEIMTLSYTITNSVTKTASWSTSDANVAYVKPNSDGSATIVGMANGVATITATMIDNGVEYSASCVVKVGEVKPSISLSHTEALLPINQVLTLSYTITNSITETATWSTSNANVAYVITNSNGMATVVGMANGVATITATMIDNGVEYSASCVVTVGTSDIESIDSDNNAIEVARYDIHGRLLSEPTPGINIVKYSDGTTRKEIVKN